MRKQQLLLFLFALFVFIAGSPLCAQGDRGTITGVVSDSSGAVVPKVQIMVTNEATGVVTSTVTTDSGAYTAALLPIGTYTVQATAAGFKASIRHGVQVQVGQTARIDVLLEVGQVTESTTVTAEAPLVNTETSDVGMVVNKQTFLQLPLTLGGDIRNPSSFIFLSPGVSGNTWEKHVSGNGSFTDAVYYDGVALNGPTSQNDAQYNPSVDAIAEFKLSTNNYSAEYGHALGGVTSFTLKSGTNDVHGSLFEFFRNEKLDARGFYGKNKVPTRQNEFGGTVGGPIRKNKTFFFVSVDSFRRRQGAAQSMVTIPLPAFYKGDFSRWTSQIYDPATSRSDGKGGFIRDPFAGNQIPTSRLSAVAQKVAAVMPAPTIDQLTGNYLSPLAEPLQDDHNVVAKIDHVINDKHKLFGSFIMSNRPAIKGLNGVEGPAEDHNHQDINSRLVRISEDWTIAPTTLNHFIASLDRIPSDTMTLSLNQGWPEKLGLKGVPGDMFPNIGFGGGYTTLGNASASGAGKTSFGLQDSVTMIRGKHSLKLGFEVVRRRENSWNKSQGGGYFWFSQLETAKPGTSTTGNSIASFMLGAVDSAQTYLSAGSFGVRWTYYGSYIQDDFKVTRNLTLNLGLRWELQQPFIDPQDRLSYMDPSLPNPGAGNVLGAMSFAGDAQGRNGWHRLADTQWKNFGPRLGFAYNMGRNTVVRGGYGIAYYNVSLNGIGIPNSGFTYSPVFASSGTGLVPAFSLDDGLPASPIQPPTITPTLLNGQSAGIMQRGHGGVWPYTQQWNLTFEKQLRPTLAVRAGYLANKGTHLFAGDATNWNQLDPRFLTLGSLLNANINSAAAKAAGYGTEPFPGFSQLWGSRATVAQALRRFPQYSNVSDITPTYGDSIYHSLQLSLEKRMANGLSLNAAYTFSKSMDDTNGFSSGVGQQNYFDRSAERSVSSIDQPHVLSFGYVYELPFGPHKHFLAGGVGSKVLGGWTVSALQRYASGTPLAFSVTNTLPIFNGTLRPNSVLGVDQRAPIGPGGFDPARDRYLNAAAFSVPAPYTFGNVSRYVSNLRTFWGKSESIAAIKDTPIRERLTLQFRAEVSNPMNRVVFGAPATNLSSPSFGQISSTSSQPRNVQLGLKMLW